MIYQARVRSKDAALLKQLCKYKTSKGCLYIKQLDDIHLPTLKKLLQRTVKGANTH